MRSYKLSEYRVLLPKEAVQSEVADNLAALKLKYNDLVVKHNQLLSAIRTAKLGI